MSSTLETLPDEILMIILRYSADVSTTFRTFLGLNLRLNKILVDKRLHLLTDFLSSNTRHAYFVDYYNSVVFRDVSQQLSSTNSTVNEQQLRQCLQSLVIYYIQDQYKRLGDQVQSNLATFKSLRQQLTDNEIVDVDNQLNKTFSDLQHNPITIKWIKQIESLVLKRGARLQCSDHELGNFNLAKAINRLLLTHLNNTNSASRQLIHPITRMFKALIISNPRLLINRDYTGNGGCTVWYFLFYAVYRTQYFYYYPSTVSLNMKCYQAAVDVLLFAIQCQRLQFNIENWAEESLFDILNMIPALESVNGNRVFIENVQWEILNMITEIYILTATTPWQENVNNTFHSILGYLINRNRLDVILFIYRRLKYVRCYFNQSSNRRTIVDMMTGSKIGRQLFKILMDEKPLETWLTDKDLVFILLQKKERKLLEKLLRLSPFLVHQLDENGNDALLHVCLKVRGCRHRFVEFLITMKSDLQRKNFNGENFFDAIQLQRNRNLLEKLGEEEIIKVDVGQIQICKLNCSTTISE